MSGKAQFCFGEDLRQSGTWDVGSLGVRSDKQVRCCRRIIPDNSQTRKQLSRPETRKSVSKYILHAAAKSNFIGFNKIASSKTMFEKIFWSLLTLCCLSGFLYQALKFYLAYQSLPIEVTLRVENNGTVEFPAVTVCNNNRIRKSQYCKYFPQQCNMDIPLKLTEEQTFRAYYKGLNSEPQFKSDLAHSLQKMVKGCIFNGEKKLNTTECKKRFQPIFDPDYGNCFMFSSKQDINDEYSNVYLKVSEADFWRRRNDLILLLDSEMEEHTEDKRHVGFTINIHAREYAPDLHTDSMMVEQGLSHSFAVEKGRLNLTVYSGHVGEATAVKFGDYSNECWSTTMFLPLPYKTNCTDFSTLPWNQYYHFSNPSSRKCTIGCSIYLQFENCNYVTANLSLFYEKLPWNISSVSEDQKTCAANVEDETMEYCRDICTVPCVDVQFEVAVGKAVLEKFDMEDFFDEDAELESKWKDLVIVKVFYKKIERKVYEHRRMYNDLELFSYLGGYIGVWLGFSLLNLCELLQIVFGTVKYYIYTCKRKSKVAGAYRKRATIRHLRNDIIHKVKL